MNSYKKMLEPLVNEIKNNSNINNMVSIEYSTQKELERIIDDCIKEQFVNSLGVIKIPIDTINSVFNNTRIPIERQFIIKDNILRRLKNNEWNVDIRMATIYTPGSWIITGMY